MHISNSLLSWEPNNLRISSLCNIYCSHYRVNSKHEIFGIDDPQNLIKNILNNFLDELIETKEKKGSRQALHLLFEKANDDTVDKILPCFLQRVLYNFLKLSPAIKSLKNLYKSEKPYEDYLKDNLLENNEGDDKSIIINAIPYVLRIGLSIVSLNNKDGTVKNCIHNRFLLEVLKENILLLEWKIVWVYLMKKFL